jgi:hypothetical protein
VIKGGNGERLQTGAGRRVVRVKWRRRGGASGLRDADQAALLLVAVHVLHTRLRPKKNADDRSYVKQ